MSYAALSYITCRQPANTSISSVIKECNTTKYRMGPTAGWDSTEAFCRGNMAVTHSDWDSWSPTPSASPGGSIQFTSSSNIRLNIDSTDFNCRAEVRDSQHHRDPSIAVLNPYQTVCKISGSVSGTISEQNTFCYIGLSRVGASGFSDVDMFFGLSSGSTSTGYTGNWIVVCKGSKNGSIYELETDQSIFGVKTFEINFNPLTKKCDVYIGGVLKASVTDPQYFPKDNGVTSINLKLFAAAAVRYPEADWNGNATLSPKQVSFLRITNDFSIDTNVPGYWRRPVQNPW